EYEISGMTCNGCRTHVEEALNSVEGVAKASVDLEKAVATVEMETPVKIEKFRDALQEAGGSYQIFLPGEDRDSVTQVEKEQVKGTGTGTFYCPMHCEGDKTYDEPGDCPVCGMDLVEEMKLNIGSSQYTCPMHPEVIKDEPGSCPI